MRSHSQHHYRQPRSRRNWINWLLGQFEVEPGQGNPEYEGVVAGIKPNPRILVMSGEAAIGHPLVRTLHGVWVSRQECLWIRTFTRVTRERTTVDADLNAKLNGYLALERQWLIEDFERLPPDVVLVDNLRDGWGAWAKADAELAQLLKPYVLVQTIEGIDILRRVD